MSPGLSHYRTLNRQCACMTIYRIIPHPICQMIWISQEANIPKTTIISKHVMVRERAVEIIANFCVLFRRYWLFEI